MTRVIINPGAATSSRDGGGRSGKAGMSALSVLTRQVVRMNGDGQTCS